ncbi:extensin [Afipia sp. P52-10]|uniref:extensin-like domain-containing protein n=1 Tax=Afipia sp. P52-10 TaxID=1429916 RepID=UPI0003DF054E|nr:extensin [Afipia sp. P52-10]
MPLPKPRPAIDAPPQLPPSAGSTGAEKNILESQPNAVPPQPSACRLALTEEIAIAPSQPPITGPGACGGDDIVRLEAVVLADKSRVPLKPAAVLRCSMATAVAEWVRSDLAAIAVEAGSRISELDNFDSFSCRGRNRVAGAKLSEHGRANAIDLRGVKFANGQFVALTDRGTARELREKILRSVCARFTTVLGPGSDGYHEDHIHLDLAERRNGYRICQWEVWDGLPKVAPLLPAQRPDEAPPRAVAEEARPDQRAPPAAPVQNRPRSRSSPPHRRAPPWRGACGPPSANTRRQRRARNPPRRNRLRRRPRAPNDPPNHQPSRLLNPSPSRRRGRLRKSARRTPHRRGRRRSAASAALSRSRGGTSSTRKA